MTAINSKQIQIIQSICSGKFSSRDERLEFFSDFFGYPVSSTKEMSKQEADDVIYFFKTGDYPKNHSWAFFDKSNTKHLKILSLAKELDWIDENSGFADLNRLGSWIKSSRCPIQGKTLKDMDNNELAKVIKALENMVQSKWK